MKKIVLIFFLLAFCFCNIDNVNDADSYISPGLSGVKDSVGYRVNEIERHFHNREVWYGAGAGNGAGVSTSITAWTLTAGTPANTYGSFIQLGTGQIAVNDFPGTTYFDLHSVFVTDVNDLSATYMIEIWYGIDTTSNATLMTQFPFRANGSATQSSRQELKSIRIPVGMKTWARAKCGIAGKTISFLVGLHLYPGI